MRPVLALAERYSAGLAHPWVEAISHNMAAAMALLGAIGALLAYGRPYELRLRGRARRAWRVAAGAASAGPWQWKRSRIDRMHDGAVYQHVVHSLKWTVGPSFCGLSIIALILWLGGALITQLAILPLEERHGVFCDNSPLAPILQPETSVMQSLAIATPCSPLGIAVERGKTYAIRVTVVVVGGPCYDGVYRAGPGMGQSAQLPVGVSLPAIPYRRVILSGWLQPMFEIKEPVRTESWPGRIWHGIFGWPAFIQPLYLRPDRTGGFNGRFTAHMTGNLYFFVNDAMLAATPASGWPRLRPALPSGLYGNNVGTARVKVASTEEIPATGS
ncbi:hypothetical protein [Flavisphingomonas formosensis]|uniref:hypothetical protein n=1 Tax=Flavisphingomonas formosensis TaxID=861534 RepID=UPI0012F8D420|nr:hypothetical protein [Sphingomonas formosensis]